MSKIFRLYKEGTSTYEDWNNSPSLPYNSASRDTIEDPDGASARHEITSIPSPFARIDLIKTAFKEVCKPDKRTRRVDLDGNTIFHKMVSDTLDVAEIFFNIDKYNGKVEIIKWDPQLMLSELRNSDIVGHQYLADALDKYMVSDSKTYNFGQLQNLYLLNYVEGPDELNIIGATSPATLFFSNANDLKYVNNIFFGEDKPFDSDYQPLYKRDFEFIKYLFALRKAIPNFANLFPEVDTYLNATYKAIPDQTKKNQLNNITSVALEDFAYIDVADINQRDLVEVLGYNLYKKSSRPVNAQSDFVIKSTISSEKPLVLPIEAGNRYSDLQYTTGKWGKTNKAPFQDREIDLAKRVLPFEGSLHPYLTISDFFEETIIKVPHTLNNTNYFDGRIHKSGIAFLLPITPSFFKYFTVDELRDVMADGKPMFEMKLLAGGDSVSVTLRIPIKGAGNVSYIEYNRSYYNNYHVDVKNNAGNIAEMKFTGFIMPQVRFNNPEDAIYNISCVQASSSKTEFVFYKGDEKIFPNASDCRNEDQQYLTKANNYLVKGEIFDYIQVRNHHGYCGIIVPIFKKQGNCGEPFEFAVDLGTSNTHIEYRKGQDKPQVFGFSKADRQLCEMFTPTKNECGFLEDLLEDTALIERDFLPDEIGGDDYFFPTRTVLSCSKTVDWSEEVNPFNLVNLPFTYDKRADLPYNNLKYNIKWGNGDDLRVMEAYVRCLMLIIRNKVLLNNGDLKHTKITWFYPISMAPKRLRRLKETWDEAYKEYFGDGVTTYMTESAAPIQYFFKRYVTATSLVNIDIGGGTTDIAFAKDKSIHHVTSFRFAANALFENSFSDLDDNNGIVDWHKGEILKLLEEKKDLSELVRVFNSTNNHRPSNMVSFLFGLKDNSIPKKAKIDGRTLDFNYLLQEDEYFKIVFIVFYTSIIYHIAQITKALDLDVPRHISFSGNGSKVIRVITTDSQILAKYTKLIFEKVIGKPYGKELELLGLERDSNPKNSTCKGGLIGIGAEEDDIRDKTIVFKSDCTGVVTNNDTYRTITERYKENTVKAVEDFFDFVFVEMNRDFNFDNNFGLKTSALNAAHEAAKKDLNTFLEKGIAQRQEETEEDDVIEETFFFYPIKGVLQSMSNEIYKILKGQ